MGRIRSRGPNASVPAPSAASSPRRRRGRRPPRGRRTRRRRTRGCVPRRSRASPPCQTGWRRARSRPASSAAWRIGFGREAGGRSGGQLRGQHDRDHVVHRRGHRRHRPVEELVEEVGPEQGRRLQPDRPHRGPGPGSASTKVQPDSDPGATAYGAAMVSRRVRRKSHGTTMRTANPMPSFTRVCLRMGPIGGARGGPPETARRAHHEAPAPMRGRQPEFYAPAACRQEAPVPVRLRHEPAALQSTRLGRGRPYPSGSSTNR